MFKKTIKLDENILRRNRIPILVQDESWVQLFASEEDKNIQELKIELDNLLKTERELESRLRKLEAKKIKYMKLILKASEAVNDAENKDKNLDLQLLDQYKEEIHNINEEIEEVKFQLEILPGQIREINFQLLTVTVQYGYNELEAREKVLDKSIKEIDVLRERLKELLQIKHDNEEWVEETYMFLHGILGSEVIEEIDKQKFKK